MTAVTTVVLVPPAAAQQSARIRATATVVQPPMTVAALDSAVAEMLTRSLRADSMRAGRRPVPAPRATLPSGAQVRVMPQPISRVREIRVEYVGN